MKNLKGTKTERNLMDAFAGESQARNKYTYNLMAKANQNTDMALCDISVSTPELASYKVFNMKHIGKVFMSGYIHTRRALRDAGLWNPTPDGPSLSEALEKLRK